MGTTVIKIVLYTGIKILEKLIKRIIYYYFPDNVSSVYSWYHEISPVEYALLFPRVFIREHKRVNRKYDTARENFSCSWWEKLPTNTLSAARSMEFIVTPVTDRCIDFALPPWKLPRLLLLRSFFINTRQPQLDIEAGYRLIIIACTNKSITSITLCNDNCHKNN